MATKEQKEFIRRLRKMRKHTEALMELSKGEDEERAIYSIDVLIDNLERGAQEPKAEKHG